MLESEYTPQIEAKEDELQESEYKP